MSAEPARRFLQLRRAKSSRWPTVSVSTPSPPARLISDEYPVPENRAPALPATRRTTSRSPRRTITSVTRPTMLAAATSPADGPGPSCARSRSRSARQPQASGAARALRSTPHPRAPAGRTSPGGALPSMDKRSARSAREAISVCGTRPVRMPSNRSTCAGLNWPAPAKNSFRNFARRHRRAAADRRS